MFTASIAVIFGLLVTLVSTDGVNQGVWYRLTGKGYLLVLLLLVSASFTIFDKCDSVKKESISNLETENQKQLTETLKTKLSKLDEKSDYERQIAAFRFDSAQNTMFYFRELAKKENSISDLDRKLRLAEGKNLKRKIDSLEVSLKDATNSNQKNIEANGPQIDICKMVTWTKNPKDTSEYAIEVILCNNGKRTAEDVDCIIRIFTLENHRYNLKTVSKADDYFKHPLQPSENSGRIQVVRQPCHILGKIEELDREVIVQIVITYSDGLTLNHYELKRFFKWEGFKKDSYQFNSTGFDEKLLVIK
jgi:hypothetical protein